MLTLSVITAVFIWVAPLIIRGGPLNFKGAGTQLKGQAYAHVSDFFAYKYWFKSEFFPHLLHYNFVSKFFQIIFLKPLIINILVLVFK